MSFIHKIIKHGPSKEKTHLPFQSSHCWFRNLEASWVISKSVLHTQGTGRDLQIGR